MVRITDCLVMTIAVDWDLKQETKQTKPELLIRAISSLSLKEFVNIMVAYDISAIPL